MYPRSGPGGPYGRPYPPPPRRPLSPPPVRGYGAPPDRYEAYRLPPISDREYVRPQPVPAPEPRPRTVDYNHSGEPKAAYPLRTPASSLPERLPRDAPRLASGYAYSEERRTAIRQPELARPTSYSYDQLDRRPISEADRRLGPDVDRRMMLEADRRIMPEVGRRPLPDAERRPYPEVDRRPFAEAAPRPLPESDRRPFAEADRRPLPVDDRRALPDSRPLQPASLYSYDPKTGYTGTNKGARDDPALDRYPPLDIARERAMGSVYGTSTSSSYSASYPDRFSESLPSKDSYPGTQPQPPLGQVSGGSQSNNPPEISDQLASFLSKESDLLKNIDFAKIEAQLKATTASVDVRGVAVYADRSKGPTENLPSSSAPESDRGYYGSSKLPADLTPSQYPSKSILRDRKEDQYNQRSYTQSQISQDPGSSDYGLPVFKTQSGAWPEKPQTNFPIMHSEMDQRESSNIRRSPSPEPELKGPKYDTSIYLGMEESPEEFGAVQKILGNENENLDYVRQSTGATVELRGEGTRRAPNKPLHIYIGHSNYNDMRDAEKLAWSLVHIVQEEYKEWKVSQPQKAPAMKPAIEPPSYKKEHSPEQNTLPHYEGPIKIRVPLPKTPTGPPPEYRPTPIPQKVPSPPMEEIYRRQVVAKGDPVPYQQAPQPVKRDEDFRSKNEAMPIGLLPEDDLRLMLHQKKREQELEKMVSREAMAALASKTKISIEGDRRIVKEDIGSQRGPAMDLLRQDDRFSPRDSTPRTDRSRSVSRDRARRRSRSIDRIGRNRSRSPEHTGRNRSRSHSPHKSARDRKSRYRSRSRDRNSSPPHKRSSHGRESRRPHSKERSSSRRSRSRERHRSSSREKHSSSRSKSRKGEAHDRKSKKSRSRSRSKDRKNEHGSKTKERKQTRDETRRDTSKADHHSSKREDKISKKSNSSSGHTKDAGSHGKYSDDNGKSDYPYDEDVSKHGDGRGSYPYRNEGSNDIDDIYGDYDLRDSQNNGTRSQNVDNDENDYHAEDSEIPGLGNPMDFAEDTRHYQDDRDPDLNPRADGYDNAPSGVSQNNQTSYEPMNVAQEETMNLRPLRERKFVEKRFPRNHLIQTLNGIVDDDSPFREMNDQVVPATGLVGDELDQALKNRQWLEMPPICISGSIPDFPGASNVWVLGDTQVYLAAQATERYQRGPNMGFMNARVHWVGVPGLLLGHLGRTVKEHLKTLPTPDCLIIHVGTEDIAKDSQPDYLKRVITEGLLDLRAALPKARIFWSEILEQMAADPSADVKVAMLRSYANDIAWNVTREKMQGASIVEHESFINLTNEEYYREPGIYVNDQGAFLIMKNMRLAISFHLEELKMRHMRHP